MSLVYPVSQLVDDTLHHLFGTFRSEENVLGADLSNQAANYQDTVYLQFDVGGAVPGSLIVMDDETMYVLGNNDSAKTVAVLRGYADSPTAAHSLGTVVHIDPPWTRADVTSVLRDEIRSWGPQVYQLGTVDLAINPSQRGYDLGTLPAGWRVRKVTMTPPAYLGWNVPGSVTPVPTDNAWIDVPFETQQDANTTAYPSGNALVLRISSGFLTVPGTLHVVYAAPFDVDTAWADTTDCIADVGMDPTDLDIPPLGAAWRLLMFRQPKRLFTELQGQPRDAQEVPPLSLMQAAQAFKDQRDSRLGDALCRILSILPLELDVS